MFAQTRFSGLILALLLATTAPMFAEIPKFPDGKPYTEPQKKWLVERAKLVEQARRTEAQDFERAIGMVREMLVRDKKEFGDVHRETAITMDLLATYYLRNHDYVATVKLRDELVAITAKLLGENHWRVREQKYFSQLYKHLGTLNQEQRDQFWAGDQKRAESLTLVRQGKAQEALAAAGNAAKAFEALVGKTNPHYALLLRIQGEIYLRLQRYAEAESHLQQAAELYQGIYGPECLEFATAQQFLGDVYLATNQPWRAEKALRTALVYFEKESDFSTVPVLYASLANTYITLGEHARAAETIRKSFDFAVKIYGKESAYVCGLQGSLASAELRAGNIAEAEKECRDALKKAGSIKTDTNVVPEITMTLCAVLLTDVKEDGKRAAREVLTLIEAARKVPALQAEANAVTRNSLTQSEISARTWLDDFTGADRAARPLLKLYQDREGAAGPSYRSLLPLVNSYAQRWCKALYREDKPDVALQRLKETENLYVASYGKDHWETAAVQVQNAWLERYCKMSPSQQERCDEAERAWRGLGKLRKTIRVEETLQRLQDIAKTFDELFGSENVPANHWYELATIHTDMGRPDLAAPLLERATSAYQAQFGLRRAPPIMASILSEQAYIMSDRGEYLQAIDCLVRARQNYMAAIGEIDSQYILLTMQLARNYLEVGESERARALLTDALAKVERRYGRKSMPVANILHILSLVSARNNEVDSMKKLMDEAFGFLGELPVTDTYLSLTADTGEVYASLGDSKTALGNLDWAQEQLSRPQTAYQQAAKRVCLRGLALANMLAGNVEKAEAAAREALERQSAKFPGVFSAYEGEVDLLGRVWGWREQVFVHKQQFDEGRKALDQEIEFWTKLLGKDNWRVADTRHRRDILVKVAGLKPESREQFVKIYAEANQLVNYNAAVPDQLKQLNDRALPVISALQSLLGKDCLLAERIRGRRIEALLLGGDLPTAERESNELLSTAKRLQGAEGELAGSTMNLQGQILNSKGQVDAGLSLLAAAIEVQRRAQGINSLPVAFASYQLGMAFFNAGDFSQAATYLDPALAVFSRHQALLSSNFPVYLSQYGACYSQLADADRAEQILTRARELTSATGPVSVVRALTAQALADHLERAGKHDRASDLWRECVDQYRQVMGDKSPHHIAALLRLSASLRERGDKDEPEQILQQVQDAIASRSGAESAEISGVMLERGKLYLKQGDFVRAMKEVEKGFEISRKTTNAVAGDIYATLGDIMFQQQNRPFAVQYYTQNLQQVQLGAERLATAQTEMQQLLTASSVAAAVGSALSADPTGPELAQLYERVLAWKGAVFARERRWRSLRGKPELESTFRDWENLTGRLATLALQVPFPEDRDVWEMKVRDATNERNRLETQLTRAGAQVAVATTTLSSLQGGLPAKTALVDLVEYNRRIPKPGSPGKWHEERSLAAFVVRKDQPVQRFELGAAKPITDQVDAWLKGTAGAEKQLSIPELAKIGRPLRKILWDPLAASLKDVKTVVVSPDGAVVRFPLAALPGNTDDSFLAEEVGIVMLPVPAMLPQLLKAPTPAADGALVAFGDVNYGGNASLATSRRMLKTDAQGKRSWLPIGFTPLANTGPEVDDVRARFLKSFPNAPDVVLKQSDGNEDRFRRQAQKCRWLHLATHGFFAPDLMQSVHETPDAVAATAERGGMKLGVRFHPGLLSGLALAGANIPGRPDDDDGVLSALEVSSLDLSNVELAVLSACQTALGEEAGGEGVLGLQRAFQVAGARSVVATLWPISDAATKLLMMRFYRNLWEKKMPKLEALREAQLWMITGARAAAQAGQKTADVTLDSERLPPMLLHPSIWAPFIMSGDWN